MRDFLRDKWTELLLLATIGIAWTGSAVWTF
jgi:hypothetical protein